MEQFSEVEIQRYYGGRFSSLKVTRQNEWRIPCPVHKGKDPNFSIERTTGRAICHSRCSRGWDILSLEMELFGVDFPTAKRRVYSLIGRAQPKWEDREVQCTYDYCDEDGRLRYQVVRKSGKRFSQRRPNPAGGWIWGLGDLESLPFRLPQILKEPFVAIAEGEKDVLNLERIGIPATCNSGGAGNFKTELARWFKGKRVAIFPDNDEPGRKHAMKIAEILLGVAENVRIVEIPGLPLKGDVSDFIEKGSTAEQLHSLCSNAPDWSPEFEFAGTPNESDKYVRSFLEVIEECGGADGFWDFRNSDGIPTPFNQLTDALSGGLRPGEVYVIGANQGSGKTSLALQFAAKALRGHKGVLMFSMEMGLREVYQRICAMEARVDLHELREFQLHGDPQNPAYRGLRFKLQQAMAELQDLPLLVSRKSAVTPEYIVYESQRLKKRMPISLVIVDHLQLMAASGSVRSEYEKFTTISRAMKQTAVELNVPVLLVSQTSRANAERKSTELEVHDLRGSGAIEEDAAAVMLIYEDKEDRKSHTADSYTRGPVKTWLKLAKNRYGIQGSCLPLWHFKRFTRFDLTDGRDAEHQAA